MPDSIISACIRRGRINLLVNFLEQQEKEKLASGINKTESFTKLHLIASVISSSLTPKNKQILLKYLVTKGYRSFLNTPDEAFESIHHGLDAVQLNEMRKCLESLVKEVEVVIHRPHATWAVANSRNRSNWQLTTLKHSRNILRLIDSFI